MAQWTQTLEPYIRVHEEVKSMGLNPTAGEDLIIGVTLISDAGPSTPTLIRGQKEFLATYTSQDLTQEYIESLNQLYTGDDKTLAANMWANAYRLAGSNTMLVVRASKANGMYYAKPLTKGDLSDYILRDGELLKKVSPFKVVLDTPGDYADHDSDGWNINISGVGIFGNRTTDDGPQYDYFVNDLPSLVDNLNDTSKFFSPAYKFYTKAEQNQTNEITDPETAKTDAKVVVFEEVYLGHNILDKTDSRTQGLTIENVDYYSIDNGEWKKIDNPSIEERNEAANSETYDSVDKLPSVNSVSPETICKVRNSTSADNDGLLYMIICQPDWTEQNPPQSTIDLNSSAYSGFTASEYYATNVYNSATQLAVRIRRFNHDAVVSKELTSAEKATLTENGKSPYSVLKNVLDTYTANGTKEPAESILKRDFFEIAVYDPSINGEVSFFNIGNVLGRGDMEVSEVNELIKMIQLNLPDDLHDLGLNYYGYKDDDYIWETTNECNTARWEKVNTLPADATIKKYFSSEDLMYSYNHLVDNTISQKLQLDDYVCVGAEPNTLSYYELIEATTGKAWEQIEYDQNNPPTNPIFFDTPEQFHEADINNYNTGDIARVGNNDDYTYYELVEVREKQWNLITNNANITGPIIYYSSVETMNNVDTTGISTGTIACIGPEPVYYQFKNGRTVEKKSELPKDKTIREIYTIESYSSNTIQNYKSIINGNNQLFADLTIHINSSAILNVSDSDFKKAMDQILEDEVYTTEGLCDLGNTELSFQNYLANMAISENGNYFYPISTVNSTNYMTIGNSATKISQDSYKLYMSTPWDIDTGNLGWKFYASPSVLYWESVARNRRNNNEFASILGQSYGLMQYQRPVTEFNKKTRQLLLSRRVNSVMWNVATQAWNMNDCYTKQNENNIMSEDGNSRLMIRISKAMPIILRQFIGRKITEPLCAEVRGVIDYFFRTNIISMNVTVDAYQIFCDFDEALARQNKIKVVVNCRYQRSLKYIEVYNRAFDVGMDISNPN